MTAESASPDPQRRGVGQGLISGTAWTALHVGVSVPIAFLVNVVVARSLGVVDYGRLAILTMVIALATAAASLGVGAALMQFVTKASEEAKYREIFKLVGGAQGYNILIAAPVVAIVVAVVVDVPIPFLLLAIVFGIFGPAFLQVGPILLATQHRSDRAAQIAIVTNLLIQATVVATVLARPSAEAVWVARVVATGSLMILPFLALSPVLRRAAMKPIAPWSLPRAFWAFAIPTGLATLVSKLVTDRVQVFFLEWLSDSVSVGLYALAFGLAVQILAPVQAAVGPLLPAFTALRNRGEATVLDGLLRVTKVSAVSAGCVLAPGVPILAALIPWIYGAGYAQSANYFVAMACSAGIVVVGAGAYASLMARLKGRTYLYVNLFALVIMAAIAVTTIPYWGAWGAVASFICGSLARAVLMILIEARHYQISAMNAFHSFLPALLAIVIIIVVWFGVVRVLEGEYWFAAAVGGGLSAAAFAITLRLTGSGLGPQDRAALLGVVPPRVRPAVGRALRLISRSERRRTY